MQNCCTSLLVAVNTVTLLIGLVVTGFSIYLLVTFYNNNGGNSTVNSAALWAAWAPFVIGIIISVMAFVGCRSAQVGDRCCIGVYGFMQLFFGIVLIVSGTFWILSNTYMQNISTSAPALLSPGVFTTQQSLSDATTGLFYACCSSTLPSTINKCNSANNIGTSVSSVCYWNQDVFAAAASSSAQTCNDFLKSKAFVCPSSNLGTSGTAVRAFQATTSQYIKKYLFPTGIVFVIAGSILVIAFMGSMYLACCARRVLYVREPIPVYKTGGDLAGGPQTAQRGVTMV